MTSMTRTPTRERTSGWEIARLVRSAGQGDSQAWNRIVEEFGGMVWAIARAYRLNDADIADVSQSTWVKLVERLDQIQHPAYVGAWLATTARRECLRVLRASHRRVLLDSDLSELESPDSALDEPFLAAARDEAVWRCFARLRPSDQSLLRLLMADPRPAYTEISAALDIPIGSIGPTRARALDRLRRELEREDDLSLIID